MMGQVKIYLPMKTCYFNNKQKQCNESMQSVFVTNAQELT